MPYRALVLPRNAEEPCVGVQLPGHVRDSMSLHPVELVRLGWRCSMGEHNAEVWPGSLCWDRVDYLFDEQKKEWSGKHQEWHSFFARVDQLCGGNAGKKKEETTGVKVI